MVDLFAHALEGGGFSRENVGAALRAWVAADLLGDQYARMAQAGRSMDADVPLTSVFVDLRVSASDLGLREALDEATEQQETLAFAEAALAERFPPAPEPACDDLRSGCHLLIGGPGQGKSTLGQYIAQVHRAALLRPHRAECPAEVARALDAIPEDASKAALTVPIRALFPLRIELRELANWLVGRDLAATDLFDYLAHDVQRITGLPMVAGDLRVALGRVPALLVLDGLDEVSPSGGRDRVMQVLEGALHLRDGCADVVVASTRPQGYDGEFRRFRVWHLAPLSKASALRYAGMLIEAWLPGRVREQQQKLERVGQAAAEDATARLLRSPLQVTILTLIVGQSGRTPRSRWELFLRYYETIYAREQERGTYASELLADHRAVLDSAHDLVGLVLQAEGETATQSTSLLTRARLEDVVVHQLRERGHSEPKARALAQEILQAASQRLVLLAELRPGQYGFDVRSLQEFMAARQLTSGDAGVVFERLRAIGRSVYWRNVLRFAVGSYFAGNTSAALRRRMSIQLCEQVAADHASDREFDSYAGAELAVDLLEDGAVGVDLHCVRGLVTQILPLLTVRRDDGRSTRWGKVLASQWQALDDSDAATICTTIGAALDEAARGDPWASVWRYAAALAEGQAPEVRALLDAAWVRMPETARRDAMQGWLFSHNEPVRAWAFARFEEEAATFPIAFVHDLPRANEGGPRLQSMRTFLHELHPGEVTLRGDGAERQMIGYVDLEGSMGFGKKLLAPPLQHGEWAFFQIIRPFLSAPNASTLASVLRTLAAARIELPSSRVLPLPWPLAASLRFAPSPERRLALALRIEAGALGDEVAWRAMEASWRAEGFCLDDLTHEPPADLPFEAKVGGAGLPASAEAGLRDPHVLPPSRLDELLRRVRWARPDVRARVAEFVHRAISWREQPMEGERCSFSVEALEALWTDDGSSHHRELVFLVLPDLLKLAEQDADRLDRLLLGFRGWATPYLRGGISRDKLALEVTAFWLAAPHREGALCLLAWLSSWDVLSDTLRGQVDYTAYNRPAVRVAALLLQEMLGELQTVPPNRLASELAHIAQEHPTEFNKFLFLLRRSPDRQDAVLSALWKHIPTLSGWLRVSIARDIRNRLSRRPTEFSSPSRWAALELPSPGPVAPPTTEAAAPSFDVVHLTQLKATNLRGFVDFAITPKAPTAPRGQWIILLGENGIGKTTILRGVAMALATPDAATALVGASPAVHRRHDAPRGSVAVTVNGHHFGAILNGEPGHESVRADEFTASTPDAARPWTVGYGCRRGSALGGAKREVSFGERDQLDSLFDGDRGLIHAETWLVSQKLAATLSPGSEADARYQAISHVLRAVLNVDKIDVEADTKVWVESAATGRTTLAGLSDGYVTTAGWVIDLLARWVNRCVELKKQLGDRFDTRDRLGGRFHEHMTGVVLLDEIDVYLHPRWQMGVIEAVRDLFPRLTFVVTTHNPLTLLGAQPGEVWVLRRPDVRGPVHPLQLDLPKGVRIEHILTGAWFELDSTFDRDTRERLAEHREMLRNGVPPTDPGRVEAERVLRDRLVSVGDTWIERLGIEAARRVEANRSAPEPEEHPDEFRRWVEGLIEGKPPGAS